MKTCYCILIFILLTKDIEGMILSVLFYLSYIDSNGLNKYYCLKKEQKTSVNRVQAQCSFSFSSPFFVFVFGLISKKTGLLSWYKQTQFLLLLESFHSISSEILVQLSEKSKRLAKKPEMDTEPKSEACVADFTCQSEEGKKKENEAQKENKAKRESEEGECKKRGTSFKYFSKRSNLFRHKTYSSFLQLFYEIHLKPQNSIHFRN